jgi:hypothetical protein
MQGATRQSTSLNSQAEQTLTSICSVMKLSLFALYVPIVNYHVPTRRLEFPGKLIFTLSQSQWGQNNGSGSGTRLSPLNMSFGIYN